MEVIDNSLDGRLTPNTSIFFNHNSFIIATKLIKNEWNRETQIFHRIWLWATDRSASGNIRFEKKIHLSFTQLAYGI